MTMTPAEHYAEAERLVAQCTEVNEQLNSAEAVAELATAMGAEAAKQFVMDLLPGLNLMLAEAQVHATLATAPIHTYAPVIVSAPADLIERVKVIDPSEHSRGILFIPDELTATGDENIAEALIDAMTRPQDTDAPEGGH